MSLPLSYIELSQENLVHNLAALKGVAHENTKIIFAVKGNAYGHGLLEIVRMAESYTDYFLVNSIEELRLLRSLSQKPTFILGYILPSLLPEAIDLGCIMGIFSREQLIAVEKAASEKGALQEVHLACDALLGREGFLLADLSSVFAFTQTCTHLHVSGMYGHFANIEDTTDFSHAQKQIDMYEAMQAIAKEAGLVDLATHLSATSGLLVYEKDSGKNTLVRIGIGGYGLWPSEPLKRKHTKQGFDLKPVLAWKTHVAQVKILSIGTTVGYGLTYKAQRETIAALIPQGYADGFVRKLSNCGVVLIGGRRCPVIGRVSMNMFVVDATSVPEVKEGDAVVIIGDQDDKSVSAQEVAERSDTINYEVTTRISPLLPRIIC